MPCRSLCACLAVAILTSANPDSCSKVRGQNLLQVGRGLTGQGRWGWIKHAWHWISSTDSTNSTSNITSKLARLATLEQLVSSSDELAEEIREGNVSNTVVMHVLNALEKTLTSQEAAKQSVVITEADMGAINGEHRDESEAEFLKTDEALLQSTVQSGRRAVTLWTDARVRYCFSSDASDDLRVVVQDSVAIIQSQVHCITFEEIALDATGSQCAELPSVLITNDGTGCWSHVGMLASRQNKLNLGGADDMGCKSIGTTVHELLHTLGQWHEQQRPDRDAYVNIHWENVKPGYEHNFDMKSSEDATLPYDMFSIMHYDSVAFSADTDRTISTVESPETLSEELGQDWGMTQYDADQLAFMYTAVNTACAAVDLYQEDQLLDLSCVVVTSFSGQRISQVDKTTDVKGKGYLTEEEVFASGLANPFEMQGTLTDAGATNKVGFSNTQDALTVARYYSLFPPANSERIACVTHSPTQTRFFTGNYTNIKDDDGWDSYCFDAGPCHGTAPPTVSTEESLWPQYGNKYESCGGTVHDVQDQVACQVLAVESNHPFYSYRELSSGSGKCATRSSCESPRTTSGEWAIYSLASPPQLWPQFGADYQKCVGQVHDVSDQASCQEEAIAKNNSYYQFRSYGDTNKCATASACDSPINTADGGGLWRIFKQD